MFCKHTQAKTLYLSKEEIEGKRLHIYYCPSCKKYAKESIKHKLRWRCATKGLGDISSYIYIGGYE